MNHACEYILTAYYISLKNVDELGELFIFRIDKKNIQSLIAKYGSYAHGTKSKLGDITLDDLTDVKNKKEYALRPKFGDACWNELLKFKVEEIGAMQVGAMQVGAMQVGAMQVGAMQVGAMQVSIESDELTTPCGILTAGVSTPRVIELAESVH
jgi:hypothetical protein